MTKRADPHFQQIWLQKMCKVCLVFLVILILFSDSSEGKRRLDCTKYIYAKPCRGAAAKRSDSEEIFDSDPRSLVSEFHFDGNGPDDDGYPEEDFPVGYSGSKDKNSASYDPSLAAKIWPHLQRALQLGRGQEASYGTQKRNSNEARLEKWSRMLRHLLEEQEK